MVIYLMQQIYDNLEYISKKNNDELFKIFNEINNQLYKKNDNALKIIKNKIMFIIRSRCDK